MISVEKKKAIARRYQEEVWGKGNFALLDEQLAPEFVDHRLPVGMDPRFAGARRAVQGALDAFPHECRRDRDQSKRSLPTLAFPDA